MSAARVVVLTAFLGACSRSPSDAELRGWLEETHRENEALRAKSLTTESTSWTVAVRGNVADGARDYPWAKITALAKTHVHTTDPTHTTDVNAVLDFRGVLLNELLELSGVREEKGTEGDRVTVVAVDGFLHTHALADVRRFPILLAIEQNGVALVQKTGGPVYEIIPHTSHPETKVLNPEGGAYYVTTVIVGTEALSLSVGGRVLHAADMPALGDHAVHGKAGFRFRWPSTPVKISGPRLRDVLTAAKVEVHKDDRVLVRRKPRTDIQARETTTLRGADVLACDILVGLRYGEQNALIPASIGGPAVLAFPSTCPNAAAGQPWPTFVESIEVERAP